MSYDPASGLLPHHHDEICVKSCISPEIASLNIESLTDGDTDRVCQELNRFKGKKPQKNLDFSAAGWLAKGIDPYTLDTSGKGVTFKPDKPRMNKGKTQKYESDQKCEEYPDTWFPFFAGVPDSTYWEKGLNNPAIPLVLIEGHKKGLCLLSIEGQPYQVIIIPGCWGALRKGKLHPDLKPFIKGRETVILCFDGDWRNNESVWKALDSGFLRAFLNSLRKPLSRCLYGMRSQKGLMTYAMTKAQKRY